MSSLTQTKDPQVGKIEKSESYLTNKEHAYTSNKKIKKPLAVSGTFASLMERTNNNEKKFKKFSGKMLDNNDIFSSQGYNYRKQKRYVSLEKEKRNNLYAGNKSSPNDEVSYYNR